MLMYLFKGMLLLYLVTMKLSMVGLYTLAIYLLEKILLHHSIIILLIGVEQFTLQILAMYLLKVAPLQGLVIIVLFVMAELYDLTLYLLVKILSHYSVIMLLILVVLYDLIIYLLLKILSHCSVTIPLLLLVGL